MSFHPLWTATAILDASSPTALRSVHMAPNLQGVCFLSCPRCECSECCCSAPSSSHVGSEIRDEVGADFSVGGPGAHSSSSGGWRSKVASREIQLCYALLPQFSHSRISGDHTVRVPYSAGAVCKAPPLHLRQTCHLNASVAKSNTCLILQTCVCMVASEYFVYLFTSAMQLLALLGFGVIALLASKALQKSASADAEIQLDAGHGIKDE
eukprot:2108029-Rhodomonas_salina.3